jgi:DNA-binding transcriptional LysR family regulator
MERLKALQIFKAVVDHGSFTKAADAANVAVPSVSRAVQDLEALLGVQLFNRTTRKVSLTSVGHTVLEHATGVLDCYEDLARVSNDIALDVSGDLRVEVSVLFGMSRLAPVLSSFMREYPKVRVDTRLVDNSVETLGDLADLSIVVGRSAPPSYVARSLAATRLGIYASPKFLDSAGMPVHPDDVRPDLCMAVMAGSHQASWQLTHSSTGECSVLSARSAFRTNCPSALISAAVDGLGVVIVPEQIAGIPESRGELVRILTDWRAPPLETQLLYRSRRNQPMRVRRLIDHLVRHFSENADFDFDSDPAPFRPLSSPHLIPAEAGVHRALLAA